jgi:hypothetical protein
MSSIYVSRDSSVDTATMLRVGGPRSRGSTQSTQPPVQWVPGAISLGVKRQGHEADHSPPPIPPFLHASSWRDG